MKSLLKKHRKDIALVVGNGVNLYGNAAQSNSWNALLEQLALRHLPDNLSTVPKGVALTEFYDVLELKAQAKNADVSLQREFSELMQSWKPFAQHHAIVDWARAAQRPILTSNFEHTLTEAGECKKYRATKTGFTDFYPWETYYGDERITDPAKGFGIWHINGMQHYSRSIRLGLTHYMGSVERARGLIHKGSGRRLFAGNSIDEWRGAQTWLHIVFNCPLLIFGLGLEENEVFFRWLLIERARYFKKFPKRAKPAWYAYSGKSMNAGKHFFLQGVGIEPVRIPEYSGIYGAKTWV